MSREDSATLRLAQDIDLSRIPRDSSLRGRRNLTGNARLLENDQQTQGEFFYQGVPMSELKFYKNMMLLGRAIDACLEKKLYGPALILIYSAIDVVGWLDSVEQYASPTSFKNWVEAYLLKATSIPCTALELYAARCGLLHTFTPDSKLSSKGPVRRICYCGGEASIQKLQRTINLTKKPELYVAVHINDLYEAWRLGVLHLAEELEKDPDKRSRVYAKARKFFSVLSIGYVDEVLTILEKDKAP